jgi:ABC-2 type transport system ATP-binding protein
LTGLATAARRAAGGYSLDPEGIVWLREFPRRLAAEGRAVLVSSHLMGELRDAAAHLVITGRGTVIADTSTAALLAAASGGQVTVRTAERDAAVRALTQTGAEVANTGPGAPLVSGLPAERMVVLLSGSSVPFSEVGEHRGRLEQAYLALTRDAAEPGQHRDSEPVDQADLHDSKSSRVRAAGRVTDVLQA